MGKQRFIWKLTLFESTFVQSRCIEHFWNAVPLNVWFIHIQFASQIRSEFDSITLIMFHGALIRTLFISYSIVFLAFPFILDLTQWNRLEYQQDFRKGWDQHCVTVDSRLVSNRFLAGKRLTIRSWPNAQYHKPIESIFCGMEQFENLWTAMKQFRCDFTSVIMNRPKNNWNDNSAIYSHLLFIWKLKNL